MVREVGDPSDAVVIDALEALAEGDANVCSCGHEHRVTRAGCLLLTCLCVNHSVRMAQSVVVRTWEWGSQGPFSAGPFHVTTHDSLTLNIIFT